MSGRQTSSELAAPAATAGSRAEIRWRRRLIAGAVLAAGAVAAILMAAGGGRERPQANSALSTAGTTAITRRDLVERESADGTLGYADTRPAVARLSGTVTWLPRVGAVIRRGQRLLAVDGRPVFLLNGRVPAWRSLGLGLPSGVDVRQLEANLHALGFDRAQPLTVDERFTAATAAAVRRWQAAHGLQQTGRVSLGQVIFLPGPRRIVKRDVELGGTLGGAAGSGLGGGPGGASATAGGGHSGAGGGGGSARGQLAAYHPPSRKPPARASMASTNSCPEDPSASPQSQPEDTASDGGGESQSGSDCDDAAPQPPHSRPPAKKHSGASAPPAGHRPQSQTGGSSKHPATAAPSGAGGGSGGSSNGGSSNGGDGAAPATSVLETTALARRVTVKLDANKQYLARRGALVWVTLPNGARARGRILSISSVARRQQGGQGQQGGGQVYVPVRIRLSRHAHVGALDQAPVTVSFERERRRHVLAVPVTALLAVRGGYAVEVRSVLGAPRRVRVTPGLYASGYVQVTGRGLRPGMRVANAE